MELVWGFRKSQPTEISKISSNIIQTSSKAKWTLKIWRVWLKNWACHTHLNYEVWMATNWSILEFIASPKWFCKLSSQTKSFFIAYINVILTLQLSPHAVHFVISSKIDWMAATKTSNLKWAWRAQFLSQTLQILEIN